MEYRNIPIVFDKEKIPEIKKIAETKIQQLKKELYIFLKTNEEIDIRYEIEEAARNQYYCTGQLFYGDKKIREYDNIDELFFELNTLELNVLLQQMNGEETEEI